MKKLLLVLVVLGLLICAKSRAEYYEEPFRFGDHDKVLHIGGAAVTTFAVSKGLQAMGVEKLPALALALGSTLLIATGKEFLYDSYPSRGDYVADVIGIGAGVGFAWAIDF